MAISGVTSGVASGSIRDKWNHSNLLDDENVDGTGSSSSTDKVINAVFEEKKTGITSEDFLSLMVAQLTNQDFMNPVDDTQYVTQLAQFTTMQQMQEMANYTKTSYVMSLVGKQVTAAKVTVSGLQKETGVVEGISLTNNDFTLTVNGKKFTLEQIMEIHDGKAPSGSTGDGDDTTVREKELPALPHREARHRDPQDQHQRRRGRRRFRCGRGQRYRGKDLHQGRQLPGLGRRRLVFPGRSHRGRRKAGGARSAHEPG